MAFSIEPFGLLTGGAIGAGAAGLVLWGLYKTMVSPRMRQLQNKSAALERSARLLEASINQGSEAVLLWPHGSHEEVASQQLHDLLNIPAAIRKVGFVDVLNLFEGSARVELDSNVRGLQSSGSGFRLNLTSTRLKRTFSLQGMRLVTDKGVVLGEILRIRDRTDELGELSRLSQESKTLGVESRRLRDLLDALPIPVWQRAQDLSIVYCNKAYKTAVEGDPTQAQAAQAKKFEIAAGASGADGRALALKAAGSAKPGQERHHVVIQGNRRLLELHEIPIMAGQALAGLAGCAFDYSTLDETKRELERQDKAQGELLESLDSSVAIFGTDRRLRFFNTSFAELMKLEATWLNTKPDLGELMEALRERRLLPEVANFPEFKRSWLDMFASVLDNRDELLHLPNGRTLRMLVTSHPLGGLVFIFDDVTDRFKLEESHSILSAVQRETIDNLYEAIAVFGENGRLRLYNPTFGTIWNLGDEFLKTEPHISAVIDQTRDLFATEAQWAEYKQKSLQRFNSHTAETGRIERGDGSILTFAVAPLPDGGSLFSYVDVSDTVKVEKALRERAEALEAADQLKSEFIANVSYGLRAPLTSIVGFAEILENNYFGKLNAKQHEYSRGILDASQKLMALINDILDLATIEAGYMELQYAGVDVHAMLTAIVNLVRDRAESQGLKLEFDVPGSIGSIMADERRLRQVLFNLLTNAMNFTPSGGKITVHAERKAKEMILSVSDTGNGIPAEDQARVFNKFERGSSKKSGAGLGLSLVKSLIDLHGGSVALQSEPGKGTTVTIKLPLKK